MLFVGLLSVKAHSEGEARFKQRAEWQYPEMIQVKAEYWLSNSDPMVIIIYETDSEAAGLAISMAWGDHFDVRIFPAITAEAGLAMGQMMAAAMGRPA